MGKRCLGLSILVGALLGSSGTAARAAQVASTGFEPAEGYAGNDIAFEVHTDPGWLGNWFHVNGGGPGHPSDTNPWSVSINDGTAAAGLQHYRQHRYEDPANWPNAAAARTASTIAMHRIFPEQNGRLYLRFEIRVDTQHTGPQWFKNFVGFYILGNLTQGDAGDGENAPASAVIGPLVRFDRNGSLGVNQLGNFAVIPHKWDGTGALPSAVNNWVTIEADVDIRGQVFELIYEGTSLGVYRFASEDVDSLNGLRLQGPSSNEGDASQPPNPINWQHGSSYDDIFIGTSPATGTDCDTSVLPSTDRASGATVGEPAAPASFAYTIYNDSVLSHDYSIEEALSDGTPTDYNWLSIAQANLTLPGGQSQSVTVNLDPLAPDPDLGGGVYTAYIRITDLTANCGDPQAQTQFLRKIELTVRDWEVTPTILQTEHFHSDLPADLPQPIVYSVRNVGAIPLNYAAAESTFEGTAMNYNWISLNTAGGTVNPASTEQVTVTIDHNIVGFGRNTAYVKFTQGSFTEIRKISFLKTAAGFTQVMEYLGDVDPTAPNSAGPGLTFTSGTTTVQGQIESAATSSAAQGSGNGKVYRIDDTDTLSTRFGLVRADMNPIEIDRLSGATVLARIKVLTPASDPATSGVLFVVDEHLAAAGLYGGTDAYVREVHRGAQSALPLGDGDWHILRVTAFGSVDETRYFRLYLDEDPDPVLEITPETGGNTVVNNLGLGLVQTLGFGAGSEAGTIDIAFDWVTGTNVEAFAPGQEVSVLGRSLVPQLCGDPFADRDGDADVDLNDFAFTQRCRTVHGNPTNLSILDCKCLDRDGDQDVDEFDFSAFEACRSRPTIPADLACDD